MNCRVCGKFIENGEVCVKCFLNEESEREREDEKLFKLDAITGKFKEVKR